MGEIKYNPGLILGNRPEDFFLGANSPIPHEARNLTRNWKPFRSLEETQYNEKGDWWNCSNQSGENGWEAQANWALQENLWPKEALDFFNQNGYLVDGRFMISTRFNSKMSGTKIGTGNFLYKAHDSLRKDGVVPETRWPTIPGITPQQYYSEIPADIIALGQESLKYYDWLYEFLQDYSPKTLDNELEHAPVQVAIGICPKYETGTVPVCGAPAVHAVLLEDVETLNNSFNILDHYQPYSKRLLAGYKIYSAVKGIIYPKGGNQPQKEVIVTPLTKDVVLGDAGETVSNLKRALAKLGWLPNYIYNPGTLDTYDSTLAQIVFNFQMANISHVFLEMLLALKGRRVGPKTRAVLNEAIKYKK